MIVYSYWIQPQTSVHNSLFSNRSVPHIRMAFIIQTEWEPNLLASDASWSIFIGTHGNHRMHSRDHENSLMTTEHWLWHICANWCLFSTTDVRSVATLSSAKDTRYNWQRTSRNFNQQLNRKLQSSLIVILRKLQHSTNSQSVFSA